MIFLLIYICWWSWDDVKVHALGEKSLQTPPLRHRKRELIGAQAATKKIFPLLAKFLEYLLMKMTNNKSNLMTTLAIKILFL